MITLGNHKIWALYNQSYCNWLQCSSLHFSIDPVILEKKRIILNYLHGVVIRVIPTGHISDTHISVVAISLSVSSFSSSITKNRCQ